MSDIVACDRDINVANVVCNLYNWLCWIYLIIISNVIGYVLWLVYTVLIYHHIDIPYLYDYSNQEWLVLDSMLIYIVDTNDDVLVALK